MSQTADAFPRPPTQSDDGIAFEVIEAASGAIVKAANGTSLFLTKERLQEILTAVNHAAATAKYADWPLSESRTKNPPSR